MSELYSPTGQGLNKGLAAYQAERRAIFKEGEENIRENRAIWDSKWPEREEARKVKAKALQNARNSVRRARERNALAAWADLKAIKRLYENAANLTQSTGIPHHVDHIFPLAGKLVSGLHVESNLRVITATDNMRKHNCYEVSDVD